MKVIGTAGTSEGENAVKKAGASLVFNHRQDRYVQNILVLSVKVNRGLCIVVVILLK